MANISRGLEDYLAVSYPYELERDEESGFFVASHPDLFGCIAQGASEKEAITNLGEARHAWIEYRFAQGLAIPLTSGFP
jgi:predicted RNase H-like HicB family nuclease